MFSLGDEPYNDLIEKVDVIKFLNDGKRLAAPDNCNDKIYEIMENCWLKDRDQRPKFKDLMLMFNEIATRASNQE